MILLKQVNLISSIVVRKYLMLGHVKGFLELSHGLSSAAQNMGEKVQLLNTSFYSYTFFFIAQ